MNEINSYPTVFQLGHSAIKDIFSGPVIVEEKIDGSQFSFGVIDGELVCRSKGKQLLIDAPEKMFNKAVETVKETQDKLHPGWVYRGEFLSTPKHNTLAYDRVPEKNIIIFDVRTGEEEYLDGAEKAAEAKRIGLEVVPLLYEGKVENFEMFQGFLERISCLGGQKVEGVVVKNYALFTPEKKVAIGKYVSEAFKEIHQGSWKERNPGTRDIETLLVEKYRTPARWDKAIQHLREDGKLTDTVKDIGLLVKEVGEDVARECEDEIKEFLWRQFWQKIARGVVRGLPEYYKERLAKTAFEE